MQGGFWKRLLATIIDSCLLVAIIGPVLLMVYGPEYFTSNALIQGPTDFALTWIGPVLAVLVFWHYRSATPGKMMLSLVIADANTLQKPTTKQFTIRYFAYFVSTIPLCLGFLWIAFDSRKQGWHDKLANTVVLYKEKDHGHLTH